LNPPKLENGRASIIISTQSMERRNGVKSDAAFWITGANVMSYSWDRYMLNFYDDIKKDNKISSWTSTQSFSQFFVFGNGQMETPTSSPWKDWQTAVPRTEAEFNARLSDLKQYYQMTYPVGAPGGPRWYIPSKGLK
jgi:hypothetical protein